MALRGRFFNFIGMVLLSEIFSHDCMNDLHCFWRETSNFNAYSFIVWTNYYKVWMKLFLHNPLTTVGA